MSLTFLVPAFFLGLLSLAVPILVHLSRKQTRNPVFFPSLMFLAQLPHKTTQRRQIHRWPLLLLRCLAIALLVLAFTRPFVEGEGVALALPGGGDREVVILLDRSYSMGMGDRWQRATDAATEVVEGLSVTDRGTVILFDSGAESVTESTADRAVLRTALQSAVPGVQTTRYAPGLRYASRILAASRLAQHELVVISDFQRSGWDTDGGETSSIRLPAGTTVTPVSVADVESGINLTIESADFDRTTAAGRERVTVLAHVTSSGTTPDPVPVTLEIDGRIIETRPVDFGEGNSARAAFSPLTLPESGAARGVLRLPDDGLSVDNEFRFVLSSDQRIPVLIVEGPGTSQGASYFLERALRIGVAPGFRPEVRRASEVRAADLVGNPVVILNQAPLPGGEQGERLRTYIEQGGGLILLLGNNQLGDWPGVLPSVGGAVDRSRGGGVSLGYVDLGHPVFEAFAGPRAGDFSSARIFRYRPLSSGSFPRVLARFGDGGAALAEAPVGEGRVLAWTSTLDGSWSDLTLQPIFLPFLHQLVKYAAGYAPPQSWLTAGDVFDARGALPAGDTNGMVLSPSLEQFEVTAGAPVELGEVGFYELRDDRATGRLLSLAVNVDPAEAEQSTFDPEEMRNALLSAATLETASSSGIGLTLAERERQQNGWWYVIVAVFLLLAGETLLSNRKGRVTLTRERGKKLRAESG